VTGVNLGGWLVLEKWITPALFKGTGAVDEYSFCHELGEEAKDRLTEHRKNFITAADFTWIADQGLDAVRLPIGYWALDGQEPYHECRKYIDFALAQCEKNGLDLVLDIHGLPGSQNGYPHSGLKGRARWHKNTNPERSLSFLKQLTLEYKDYKSLKAIELMNEPLSKLPKKKLMEYYKSGYSFIRQSLSDKIGIIISDAFATKDWKDAMPKSRYKNVYLDMHMYQVFSPEDKRLSLDGHIKKARSWKDVIKFVRSSMPVIIGEWSIALPHDTDGIEDQDDALRRYASAQLEAFEEADGWFYWTYKTEGKGPWDFRICIENGWINLKNKPA
jgi:glucan 1,3-beta-glucosidase